MISCSFIIFQLFFNSTARPRVMPSINTFVAAMAVGRIPVRSVLPGALYVYSIVDALASLGRKPSLSAARTHEGTCGDAPVVMVEPAATATVHCQHNTCEGYR